MRSKYILCALALLALGHPAVDQPSAAAGIPARVVSIQAGARVAGRRRASPRRKSAPERAGRPPRVDKERPAPRAGRRPCP